MSQYQISGYSWYSRMPHNPILNCGQNGRQDFSGDSGTIYLYLTDTVIITIFILQLEVVTLQTPVYYVTQSLNLVENPQTDFAPQYTRSSVHTISEILCGYKLRVHRCMPKHKPHPSNGVISCTFHNSQSFSVDIFQFLTLRSIQYENNNAIMEDYTMKQ